jgi:superkiller protein 3
MRAQFYDPPYTGQLDHAERCRRFDKRIESLQKGVDVPSDLLAYEKALKKDPEDWVLRESYADLLGSGERAIAEYQTVLHRVPHHFMVWTKVGNLYLKDGFPDRAQRAFEAALRIDAEYSSAHSGLAKALAMQGRPDDAIAYFQRRIEREPDRAAASVEFAEFAMSLGKDALARDYLDKALKLHPDSASAHMTLGHVLAHQGATEEAIEHFEAAARARPRLQAAVEQMIAELRKQKPK